MANYEVCINWVLRLEDSRLTGEVVNLGDGGGLTRFGLTSRWHPDLVSAGFYTCDVPSALVLAKQYYKKSYWDIFKGDEIVADPVSAELLSFAINDGAMTAIELLQRVLGFETIDGKFGPITLAATNSMDSNELVVGLKQEQLAYYDGVIAKDPSKAKDLKGWTNRVNTPFIES